MIQADTLFRDFHLVTMRAAPATDAVRAAGSGEFDSSYGVERDAALAAADGRIVWIGSSRDSTIAVDARNVVSGDGRFLTPGLIDCHTHLVWGGQRVGEWEMRLAGASYEEIARRGGGILSTVAATRAASADELHQAALRRAAHLLDEGVTTIEIKSGYGLDWANEAKMLRVATAIGQRPGLDVSRTLLAAHAVPPEYKGRSDEYVDVVCREMIPAAADEGLCEAVDAFCEHIAFSPEQTERVFRAARDAGLGVKIHAEQLSNCGGAQLAARYGAWSADHLEYLDQSGVDALARAGVVAVVLPGAAYCLGERQAPPLATLRRAGVPIALATDCNPGTSPVGSLLAAMNLACTMWKLSPAEALAGVTRHAARALRWDHRLGTLEVGRQADLVVWDIEHPAQLAYGLGMNPRHSVYKRGRLVVSASATQ